MLDGFTLDQLRTFVTIHSAGNFSAAARKLKRAQSAVSSTMSNLEEQLGVVLWNRTTRIPTLTAQGEALLTAANRVLEEAEAFGRLAADLQGGIEAKVSLCVDALFPVEALVTLAAAFREAFPSVDLRIDTQTMSDVSERVLNRTATLGVASPMGERPEFERRPLSTIAMLAVACPEHPLARLPQPLESKAFREHIQVVLAERRLDEGAPDQAVLSPRTWRVTDLYTKRKLLLGGAGWGNLPEHYVREDLEQGRLVVIRPAAWGKDEHSLCLSLIYRRDMTLGPAHRWIFENLQQLCERVIALPAGVAPRIARRKNNRPR